MIRRDVLAVVGMAAEARIIRRAGGRAIIAGGGDLEEGVAEGATALLSFGLCGALSPDIAVGDVLIADVVVSGADRWSTDEAWRTRLTSALPQARRAVMAGADAICANRAARAALREATGADTVDLESHWAARLAYRLSLPFAVVRAVSDDPSRDLPAAAVAGFRSDGRADIAAVLAALIADPGQLFALVRTAGDAGRAFAALRRVAPRLMAVSPIA